MSRKYFTDEQTKWLVDNFYAYKNYRELTNAFNEKFETNYIWAKNKYSPVERKCTRMGLSRKGTSYGFTPEEDAWLMEFAERYSSKWLSNHIEAVSGRKHSPEAIKMHVREWLDIHKGNGGVREDTVQTYKRPIGSICSQNSNHATRIKIRDTGDEKKDWYPYGRYIWEQYYGVKLPSNVQIIHVDGNNKNFDISNLYPVTHQEHAILTANRWHSKGEITKTGIAYAKLIMEMKGVRK